MQNVRKLTFRMQARISAGNACRYCSRPLSLRQKLTGTRFCSVAHEEFDRRRRVQLIAGRLADTDVTAKLSRSEDYKPVQLEPHAGLQPMARQKLEFCRSEVI